MWFGNKYKDTTYEMAFIKWITYLGSTDKTMWLQKLKCGMRLPIKREKEIAMEIGIDIYSDYIIKNSSYRDSRSNKWKRIIQDWPQMSDHITMEIMDCKTSMINGIVNNNNNNSENRM